VLARPERASHGPGVPANAIAVAPATFNTVNKLAAGIADTLALGLLCEYLALAVPIVLAPNVSPPLARHPQYRRSIAELRTWGVRVLDEETSASGPSSGWMQSWRRVLEALPPPGGSASRAG
jgi:phosphopantothenoylcysteine synthetase/decarboxylase